MNEIIPFEEIQKETAKAFGKECASNVFGFLEEITRPPARELGGLLADHIKFFRFKTQISIISKARAYIKEQNVVAQEVPLKLLAPLLDSCAWEEDEWMQSKWASLLANAVSNNEKLENYPTYVELLRQLSPSQTMCLEIMFKEIHYPARRWSRSLPSWQADNLLKNRLKISDEELKILFDNLVRLNLIHPKMKNIEDVFNTEEVEVERDFEDVSLTHLGQNLVRKCIPPFSQNQKNKIKNIIAPLVIDLINIHHGQRYNNFVDEVRKINKYIDKDDIGLAWYKAANEHVQRKAAESEDIKLDTSQTAQIINRFIESLEKLYL